MRWPWMVVVLLLVPGARAQASGLDAPLQPPPALGTPALGLRPEISSAALRQYELQRLGFETLGGVDDDGDVVLGGLQPYLGKYHQPLSPGEFFALVDRPDLASSYHLREGMKTGVLVAAVAGTVVASAEGLHLVTSSPDTSSCGAGSSSFSSCVEQLDQERTSHTLEGVLLMTGAATLGTVLIVGVALVDPNPAEDWQMRQLADEYNIRLRTRLGLPEDERDLLPSLLHSLSIAPMAAPKVGGLAVSGGF